MKSSRNSQKTSLWMLIQSETDLILRISAMYAIKYIQTVCNSLKLGIPESQADVYIPLRILDYLSQFEESERILGMVGIIIQLIREMK